MFEKITDFIRKLYGNREAVSLHEPVFLGQERQYLTNCIDVGYVSTVGAYVEKFEKQVAAYTGAGHAISTVNGTAALHAALVLAGVKPGDEVLTQALTFVATSNAIAYTGAKPVFLDVERNNLGLSPAALRNFLDKSCALKDGVAINKKTGKRFAACVPVHIFGHPLAIDEIVGICLEYGIPVIEDAAEGMGSLYKGKHVGRFGLMGTLSFNGNKILTTGGGGMILTDNAELAKRAKHITTTARVPDLDYYHDVIGYNYRMPNLNAALGCAQLESLDRVLQNKTETARLYKDFFASLDIPFIEQPRNSRSNYWLNAILLRDRADRDRFLHFSNERKIFARPTWRPMHELPMFRDCQTMELDMTKEICDRLVNLPSSYRSVTTE